MKKSKFIIIVLVSVLFLLPNSMKAQETKEKNKLSLFVFADITSKYLWRGMDSPATLSFQPGISFSKGNLSFGAWGSTDVLDKTREFDLNINYSIKGFTFTLSDYFFNPQKKYFDFKNETTGHSPEFAISYMNEKFPLKIYVGTMFWGEDKKIFYDTNETDLEKNNYSTYFELSYKFEIQENSFNFFAGATPFTGMYGNDFAVVYTGVTATHNITITDKFSLPIYSTFAVNPQTEKYFVMLGIKLQ